MGLASGFVAGVVYQRRQSESPLERAERLANRIEGQLDKLEDRAYGLTRPPVRTADRLH